MVKGIDLFDTVNVPSVAVVENMAYYDAVDAGGIEAGLQDCVEEVLRSGSETLSAAARREGLTSSPSQDETAVRAALIAALVKKRAGTTRRQHIFGAGHRGRLADMWGITNTVQMPLVADVASCGDRGVPFIIANSDSEHSVAFSELAQAVVREVSKLKYSANDRPQLSFQPAEGTITIETEGDKQVMPSADLRRQCRCALCVEEFSGKPLLDPDTVAADIVPSDFAPIGNYAVSVQWSDGHSSLFPYSAFARGYKARTKRLELASI